MVIGESSTPLSNLLLEELATRYDLPGLRPLTKWGSWRDSHPELVCGLKRGFSFFHHTSPSDTVLHRENQLLVAASPHDGIADTHWYRADFDNFLTNEAQNLGVTYLDEATLHNFTQDGNEALLSGTRHGQGLQVSARFVVDATGPRGFLHHALQLGELELPGLPVTQAIYSHFTGVKHLAATGGVALDEQPPYPVDDAALHHIFSDGWVWMLHFCNGVTSTGIAATAPLADELRFDDPQGAWERMLQRSPILQAQFQNAKPIQPFRHIPRLAFRSATITGRNWALLPSAAGFVDPLLSTGFPLTLLGISRLAEVLERDWNTERFERQLQRYATKTDAELLATSRLIGALYTNMGNFPVFSALTLLYFAAASYAETARRLGRPERVSSFLLYDHPTFGPDFGRVLQLASSPHTASHPESIIEEILRVIEPIDVAGLGKSNRRNWYPVEAEDLLQAAHKLGATREEILQMLTRCGFSASVTS
jgi:FADH2 O2-dependent halogenase